jgi:hypothetical protein
MPNNPLPPPKIKKPDNKIDANEAKLIGAFFVTVGNELNDANAELRTDVLKRADSGVPIDYYWIDGAEAEYKLAIEVGTNTEGGGKKRESEVVLKAQYKRTSVNNQHAPHNVLFGVISPAERQRQNIITTLNDAFPASPASPTSPIFHLGGSRFWVVVGGTEFYVVELGPPNHTIKIKDLNEMKENLKGMFLFLETQLAGTHTGS